MPTKSLTMSDTQYNIKMWRHEVIPVTKSYKILITLTKHEIKMVNKVVP